MTNRTDLPTVEQQQPDDTHADAGIGEVEHRTEEDEMLTADKGHPQRPVQLKQREVEHIHHLSHQERGVTRTEGHEIRDIIRRGLREYQTIEQTVDQI